MAAAQQADEKIVHQVLLSHNDLTHFQGKKIYKLAFFLNALV